MHFSFGCSHKRTSFPITLRTTAQRSGPARETYIVCLECGREFPYSWEEMKVVRTRKYAAVGTAPRLAISR
jgi:hypothetical protein